MVEQQVRLFNFQASTLSVVYEDNGVKKPFNEPHFFFADSGYFKIFDHKFLKGNPEKALSGPGYVVITKSTAERYFGTTDALGKIISFEGKYPLMVNAVIEDVPSNSHFTFDFLASMTSLPALNFPIPEKNWYWNPVWTYVLLKHPSNRGVLQDQLHAFVQKYYHPAVKDETELNLQPVTNIYLYSKSEYEIGVMSDVRNIKLFSIIGLVILLIAIINFINLSTARATDRFKEIGVRKVTGASKQRPVASIYFRVGDDCADRPCNGRRVIGSVAPLIESPCREVIHTRSALPSCRGGKHDRSWNRSRTGLRNLSRILSRFAQSRERSSFVGQRTKQQVVVSQSSYGFPVCYLNGVDRRYARDLQPGRIHERNADGFRSRADRGVAGAATLAGTELRCV